jgi:flagellar protein FliJ
VGFDYRLQRVMTLHENEKQQLELAYQTLYEKLEEQGRKLIEVIQKKEALVVALHQASQNKMTAHAIHDRLSYIEALGNVIESEQRAYSQLKERVEAFQVTLQDKAIEVKKHEKLREKAYQAHLVHEKRIELKRMDEQAQKRAHL